MNKSPTNKSLALVGVGYWGKNLARNFYALGALHTICDTDENNLNSCARDYAGVTRAARLESVFENPQITQVAIAVPAAYHYQIAKAAILSGKDVFVEKPLCLNENEGEELVALASH